MVIKKCKICGEEFEARGSALTCSSECRKINKRNLWRKAEKSDKGKATRKRYRENHRDEISEYQKEWYKNNRDKILEQRKEYYENNRDEILERHKEYQKSDRGKDAHNKANLKYKQKKIAELNEKFDGDIELILKECPHTWEEREAIMQVEYGKSYIEAIYKKIKISPVCEVTGRSDDLVIHHLDSFNLHPEKGADLDNLVRITREIHNEFHSIYGWGDNTREQWFEFLEKKINIILTNKG